LATDKNFARTAIWFTPKSVAGFDADDFPELSEFNRMALKNAVDEFLLAVDKVPATSLATSAQLADAMRCFEQLMQILEPYLAFPDEVAAIERALVMLLPLPDWIVNWDFELHPDAGDVPAVYFTFYVDEERAPKSELGRTASALTSKLREVLRVHGLDRWPYVRFRSITEHKVA
jgi:hypothetical protein